MTTRSSFESHQFVDYLFDKRHPVLVAFSKLVCLVHVVDCTGNRSMPSQRLLRIMKILRNEDEREQNRETPKE